MDFNKSESDNNHQLEEFKRACCLSLAGKRQRLLCDDDMFLVIFNINKNKLFAMMFMDKELVFYTVYFLIAGKISVPMISMFFITL